MLYTAGFSYMIALGLVQVLVPLYALHLGFDLAELGVIVASQAVFGLMLRLIAGAIADQFGERRVLWFSFGTMVVGSLVFAVSGDFWVLITAQTFMGFSRATYWTVTQSYASRINRDRTPEIMGRINSSGNMGSVIGTLISGFMAVAIGYENTFLFLAALGLVGLLGSLALPELPRKASRHGFKQSLGPIPELARTRGMYMAGIAAWFASSSVVFTAILFIPYFETIGYSEGVTSTARTVVVVGSVATGLVFGQIMARFGSTAIYAFCFTMQGLLILAIPQVGDALWVMGSLMFAYGVIHGTLGISYPVTAAAESKEEQRGMAMAYTGLYWGIAQLAVPVIFGFVAVATSLGTTFWLGGLMFVFGGLLMPVVHPSLTKKPVDSPAVRSGTSTA